MLIRVHGSWSGDIFGLPPGMQWEQTPDGIRLYYAPEGVQNGGTNTLSTITNDVSISNKVQVYALTGNNQVRGDNGLIDTGNAYADATVFNIANTNVIGSNWMNLIFNIYGNWNGNLSFGQPDLWLGVRANADTGTLRPGTAVTYTYTIFNQGDTRANEVYLENTFPTNSLVFENGPTNLLASSTDKTRWNIGSIAAGETRELVVETRISQNFGARARTPLPLAAMVHHNQPDGNELDNEDSVLLYVGYPNRGSGGSRTIACRPGCH
jgi:uncharacterized repeat protein (TIGR01451 family)